MSCNCMWDEWCEECYVLNPDAEADSGEKWEYLTQKGFYPSDIDFLKRLRELGESGWELVGDIRDKLVFKRPKRIRAIGGKR